jgi:hypothetical protein
MLRPFVGQESDLGLAPGVRAREKGVKNSNEAYRVQAGERAREERVKKSLEDSPAIPFTFSCPFPASDQSNFGFGLGGFLFPKLLLLVV